jgi:hypothetical protein
VTVADTCNSVDYCPFDTDGAGENRGSDTSVMLQVYDQASTTWMRTAGATSSAGPRLAHLRVCQRLLDLATTNGTTGSYTFLGDIAIRRIAPLSAGQRCGRLGVGPISWG